MKISVCVATYNGSMFIKQQLDSILIQLGEKDEVIISDDSSTDNTIEIIKSLNDNRIQLFEDQLFKHHTPNFEFALSKSSGDYIFLSDQDDIWMSGKVKIMTHWLEKYNLVVSDCIVVNEYLQVISPSFFKGKFKRNGLLRNIIHNHFLGCCMAFDRRILDMSLPFPSNNLSHESWIGGVSEVFGKTKFITDKLILFRRHDSNNSNTLKVNTTPLKEQILFRLRLILNLIRLISRNFKIFIYHNSH